VTAGGEDWWLLIADLSLKLKNELSTSSSFLFFWKGADNGRKTEKGPIVGHEQKKNDDPLVLLSIGTMVLELTRANCEPRRRRKKKKMSPIGRLSIGTVGQKQTKGWLWAKKKKKRWAPLGLLSSWRTELDLPKAHMI